MNDLISRKALINIFQEKSDDNTGLLRNNMLFAKKLVESMPTDYDVDKVVEQLEERAQNADKIMLGMANVDERHTQCKIADTYRQAKLIAEGAVKDE